MDNHAQLSFLHESHPVSLKQSQAGSEIPTTPVAQPAPPASGPMPEANEAEPPAASASMPVGVKPSPKRIMKPMSNNDERYLSVKEVASRYSVSVQTVWRHTKDSPDFPKPVKVLSGSTRWKLRDLVAYEAFREEDA